MRRFVVDELIFTGVRHTFITCSYTAQVNLADLRHYLQWCRGKRCRLNPVFLRDRCLNTTCYIDRDCERGYEMVHKGQFDQSCKDARNGYYMTFGEDEL